MSKGKKIHQQAGKTVETKDSKSTLYFLAGILLLTVLIYANSFANNLLHFDDDEYFTKYPEILQLSFSNIKTYFSNYYVLMYQPLPILTFAINYHFSGLNAFSMHVFNLCLHLINILLVFRFTALLSGDRNASLMMAFIFALHPMNVEAVSWISARSSGMYTLFYLAGACSYIQYILTENNNKYLALTLLFFVLSLFSKVQAITFPVFLVLIDFFFSRKYLSGKVLLEKVPFFLLSIVFGLIAVLNKSTMENITSGMMISYSPVDGFFMICYSFVFYLFKFILPVSLCAIHVYPLKSGGTLPVEYYVSPLLLAALIYFIYRMRKNKVVLFGIGLFVITISVNIQLIPSRLFIVADRYAYFPYIGLALIPVLWFSQVKTSNKVLFDRYLIPSLIVLSIFGIFSSFSVYSRNPIWNNDESLMTDIITKNAEVPYISRAYGTRGNFYKQSGQLNEAVSDFSDALRIKKDDAASYVNRGLALADMNKIHEAFEDMNTAVSMQPKSALFLSYRAIIKVQLADTLSALADCNLAIRLDSTISEAYNERAVITFSSKDYASCESDLKKAVQFKPAYGEAHKNLGNIYFMTSRPQLACVEWKMATDLGNQDAKMIYRQYCN